MDLRDLCCFDSPHQGNRFMTQSIEQVLTAFDALPEHEKHLAAVEVLRRAWPQRVSDLSDDAFLAAADAVFVELDAREAADAQR
jgi:hypothetical protein